MKKYLIITLLIIFSNEIHSQKRENLSNEIDTELNIKKQKMSSVSVGKIVPNVELYDFGLATKSRTNFLRPMLHILNC